MTAPHPWIDLFIVSMYIRLTVNLLTVGSCLVSILFLKRSNQRPLEFISLHLWGTILFFLFFSFATIIGLSSGSYQKYDYANIIIAGLITLGSIGYVIGLSRFLLYLFAGRNGYENHDVR